MWTALGLVGVGGLAGSLLIAALAELGPRLGVPSVIAARAALGLRGAGLVAVLLYATNFAWIAVNNVIAASACAQVAGRPGVAARLGRRPGRSLSTLIVAGGPRLVALADRLAVPLLLLVGRGPHGGVPAPAVDTLCAAGHRRRCPGSAASTSSSATRCRGS